MITKIEFNNIFKNYIEKLQNNIVRNQHKVLYYKSWKVLYFRNLKFILWVDNYNIYKTKCVVQFSYSTLTSYCFECELKILDIIIDIINRYSDTELMGRKDTEKMFINELMNIILVSESFSYKYNLK